MIDAGQRLSVCDSTNGMLTDRSQRGAAHYPIEAGTLWRLSLADPVRGEFQTTVLVLACNDGNRMAIAVSVV